LNATYQDFFFFQISAEIGCFFGFNRHFLQHLIYVAYTCHTWHYTATIVLMKNNIFLKFFIRAIFRAGYFVLGKKISEFSDKNVLK